MAISTATRQLVRDRAQGRCEYCHADELWQFVRFTMDHVLPLSEGGTDLFSNLALACRNCNERRRNVCSARDPISERMVAVFDPRSMIWSEHFTWSADKKRLIGVTPTGRATIELLDINDDRHDGVVIRLRQRDLDDGFHPPPGDPILGP